MHIKGLDSTESMRRKNLEVFQTTLLILSLHFPYKLEKNNETSEQPDYREKKPCTFTFVSMYV